MPISALSWWPAVTFGVVPDIESFQASDGVAVSFHRLKPADVVEVGMPPVFLLHGFASDSQISWIDPGLTQKLVDAGREVFAVDAVRWPKSETEATELRDRLRERMGGEAFDSAYEEARVWDAKERTDQLTTTLAELV